MRFHLRRISGNEGSAFVISILVLFVLSVLGLALMLTTTTEKDIAINYRWGEQAFFNADAALEFGKNVLAAYALASGDLANALPPARGPAEMNLKPADAAACADPGVAGCRDYQYSIVEGAQTIFIGRVLRDLNGRPVQYDFRLPGAGDTRDDVDGDGVRDIEGTVTVWVRRPIVGDRDYDLNNRAILTAEGTAPNAQAAGGGKPVSLRRLEMGLRLPEPGLCGDQYSDAARGSDADPCGGSDTLAGGGVVADVN